MIRQRPSFIQAVIEQAEHIGATSPASAERFLDAVEETLAQLALAPRMGRPWSSPHPRLRGVRVWPVRGFPKHLIFYRLSGRDLHALDLIHGARDLDALLGDD